MRKSKIATKASELWGSAQRKRKQADGFAGYLHSVSTAVAANDTARLTNMAKSMKEVFLATIQTQVEKGKSSKSEPLSANEGVDDGNEFESRDWVNVRNIAGFMIQKKIIDVESQDSLAMLMKSTVPVKCNSLKAFKVFAW
jgi:hypothetical protein